MIAKPGLCAPGSPLGVNPFEMAVRTIWGSDYRAGVTTLHAGELGSDPYGVIFDYLFQTAQTSAGLEEPVSPGWDRWGHRRPVHTISGLGGERTVSIRLAVKRTRS